MNLPYHIWKRRCPKYPNCSVIFVHASSEFSGTATESDHGFYRRGVIDTVQRIPGYSGMVYAMRNRRYPDLIKIGKSKNAIHRMSQSPWQKSLGFTSKEDRIEEIVLACINEPAENIERSIHNMLGEPVTEMGWGKEWFKATAKEVIGALQDIKFEHHGDAWLCHDTHPEVDDDLQDIIFGSDPHPVVNAFAGIGEINHSIWRSTGHDIVSSIWCSVRYWKSANSLPVPFFALPEGVYQQVDPALPKELLTFEVDSYDMIPDVAVQEGQLIALSDHQRIYSASHVGSDGSSVDSHSDVECGLWDIDGEVYQIDFLVNVQIREFFQYNNEGQIYRAGCEQIC